MWIVLSIIAALAKAGSWALKKKMMQNPELNLHIATIGSVTSGVILASLAVLSQQLIVTDWELFLKGGLATAILNYIALFFLLRALSIADLGYLMAWLTVTSLTIMVPPVYLLHEIPSKLAFWGILLIFIGAYFLENGRSSKNQNNRQAKYLLLIIGTCYTLLPTFSKFTIKSSSPLLASAFVSFVVSFLFVVTLAAKKQKTPLEIISLDMGLLAIMVVAGLLASIETLALYVAFDLKKVSYVMGLKRTAPIFALIMSCYLFNEHLNFKKIAAIACLIAGAVTIGLSQ